MTGRRLTVGQVVRGTVVAALLSVAALLVASYALGWRLLVVESGSMAPTYAVGSLTVVTTPTPTIWSWAARSCSSARTARAR